MLAKPLSSPAARVVVAAVSVAVLALGLLLRPHAPESLTLPATEAPAPMLQELIAEREAPQTIEAVRSAAGRVSPAVVSFSRAAAPPVAPALNLEWRTERPTIAARGAGLLISSEGDVLTVAAAVGGSAARARLSSGREVAGTVTVYDPGSGLIIVKLDAPGTLEPAAMADQPPGPGEMVFAGGRVGAGDTVAPMFVIGREGDEYLLSGGGAVNGAPLFTVAGRAFAIAAAGGVPRAYALGAAIDRLRRLAAEGRGNPTGIGTTFQPMTGDLAGAFDSEGALVADVAPGSPADAAGLRAGDVLTSVAGQPAPAADAAAALIAALPPWLPATFTVRRGRQSVDLVVTPERLIDAWWRHEPRGAPAATPLVAGWLGDGFTAANVSRATRLLAVNGRPPTATLRPRKGAVLYVEDGGQRFFTRVR